MSAPLCLVSVLLRNELQFVSEGLKGTNVLENTVFRGGGTAGLREAKLLLGFVCKAMEAKEELQT